MKKTKQRVSLVFRTDIRHELNHLWLGLVEEWDFHDSKIKQNDQLSVDPHRRSLYFISPKTADINQDGKDQTALRTRKEHSMSVNRAMSPPNQLIRSFNVIRIESAGLTISKISFWTLLNGGISADGRVSNIWIIPWRTNDLRCTSRERQRALLDRRNSDHPDVNSLSCRCPWYETDSEDLAENCDSPKRERSPSRTCNPFHRRRLNIPGKHEWWTQVSRHWHCI